MHCPILEGDLWLAEALECLAAGVPCEGGSVIALSEVSMINVLSRIDRSSIHACLGSESRGA